MIDIDEIISSMQTAIVKTFPKARTDNERWQKAFNRFEEYIETDIKVANEAMEQLEGEQESYETQLDDVEGELEQLKADTISREDEKEHDAMVASFNYYAERTVCNG